MSDIRFRDEDEKRAWWQAYLVLLDNTNTDVARDGADRSIADLRKREQPEDRTDAVLLAEEAADRKWPGSGKLIEEICTEVGVLDASHTLVTRVREMADELKGERDKAMRLLADNQQLEREYTALLNRCEKALNQRDDARDELARLKAERGEVMKGKVEKVWAKDALAVLEEYCSLSPNYPSDQPYTRTITVTAGHGEAQDEIVPGNLLKTADHGETEQSPTWPYIMAFARRMEAKLAKNRHKGDRPGWLKDRPITLLQRVVDEVSELNDAVSRGKYPPDVWDEAADVANMAMMTADSYEAGHGEKGGE